MEFTPPSGHPQIIQRSSSKTHGRYYSAGRLLQYPSAWKSMLELQVRHAYACKLFTVSLTRIFIQASQDGSFHPLTVLLLSF